MHIFKDLAIQTLSGEDKLETSISDDKPGNHVKITNASQMNPSWENSSGESYICDASVCWVQVASPQIQDFEGCILWSAV